MIITSIDDWEDHLMTLNYGIDADMSMRYAIPEVFLKNNFELVFFLEACAEGAIHGL